MKASPLVLLTVLLAATTVGAGALAWHQHQKLKELQAVAARNAAERAEWQARLAAVERAPIEPLAEPTGPAPAADVAPADASGETTAIAERRGGPAGGPGRRGNPLVTLMQDPAFASAMITQQKGALDQRYADLFRRLNLTPAQVDEFKALLVERQTAAADVMAAAREQGLDGREARDELRKLVQETQAQTDERIRSLLGEAAYTEYKTYEQTQPQRALVSQLSNKLSYTSTPLQSSQMDQLVRILAETGSRTPRVGEGAEFAGRGDFVVGAMQGGQVRITDEVIARAQSVLNQSQLEGLKQIQAEQKAQRDIGEALRNASRANRGGTASP